MFIGFKQVLKEVALAFSPLVACIFIFQFWVLKLSKAKFINILKGLGLTFVGLALFLQGVKVGFLPAGEVIGSALGGISPIWILIPIGFIIGSVTTLAEPSVHTLNYEVENASGGYIPQKVMLYTLALGVGVSIAVSMGRIILGIPLAYFLIPGYLLAFILTRYCSRPFIAIAFDSGSVATGPMTVTFILAIILGITSAIEGRNPLLEGFGMITLVAVSSVISVLVLGVLYGRKEMQVQRQLNSQTPGGEEDAA
ncbi:MAG: DUF1538 domain-containing protein [Syntrophomonadaceae bacterium]|nr:DUF1538 domain-containing protein [Syntrophomonadaceae bacterium]